MRPRIVLALPTALLAVACATAPEEEQADAPACDPTSNCFYERNIRSFRALDNRTIIVLVGRDRCPYRVELDGFFCDVAMSSFLAFDDTDGRICTWDRASVVSGPFVRDQEYCRVREVAAMTDDELLEAYATHGHTAPPPAKGSGELEVLEEEPGDASGGRSTPASEPQETADPPRSEPELPAP
jgi:hypothetical protein